MIPARGERYRIEVYKRKANSAYEWEETPYCVFYGRPANQMEKRTYRIQKGVNGNSDSVFILSSNLNQELNLIDKVVFLGKEWKVESIGFYFDSNLIVNPNIMSDEYLIKRCPKGVALQ